MISSDKAGVQFPDSESSFCFCSTMHRRSSFGGQRDVIFCPNEHQLLLNTKFDARHITPRTRRPRETSGAMASAIQERTAHRHQDDSFLIVIIVFRSHRSRSTLASPHGDTCFNSRLRTDERVFSGSWLVNKTEKMARITWQKLDLEISDLAMEDWGKAQELG